jgi:hypothetical protein
MIVAFQNHQDGFELLVPVEEVIRRYRLILNDVEVVHSKDRVGIRSMLTKFGSAGMDIGIGYKRAYGTALSGDSFQLFALPRKTLFFVFSDVSGHGLEAYTTYIKLRSAAILAVRNENNRFDKNESSEVNYRAIVHDIVETFTNIMEDSISRDFACVLFVFVNYDDNGNTVFHFSNRGMYYPFMVIPGQDGTVQTKNLNDEHDNWSPVKNSPLGSDFRDLLGKRYDTVETTVIRLNKGGRLCFFTDGITEAPNENDPPEEFGVTRLEKSLTETFNHFPQSAINTLYDEIFEFIGNPIKQIDDMTAVMIDVPGQI